MDYNFNSDPCPEGFRMFNGKTELKNLSDYGSANKLVITSQGILASLRKSYILGGYKFTCKNCSTYLMMPMIPRDTGVYTLKVEESDTMAFITWNCINKI